MARLSIPFLILLLAAACAPAQHDPAIASPATVDELLTALETADRGIETFEAGVHYDRRFILQGDRHIREGKLYYKVVKNDRAPDERPRRIFAVHFDHLTIDDVVRDESSSLIFDGQWLIEKRSAEKQFIAHQVAHPDQPIDPLGLGESPLPFPLGQKKSAILERYDAAMLAPEDSLMPGVDADTAEVNDLVELRKAARDTYQLRLTPKAGRADDDQFTEIRLWYTKDRLLPRMARTTNRAGDESIVLLLNPRLNDETFPLEAIDGTPPKPDEGWDVQYDEGRFKNE